MHGVGREAGLVYHTLFVFSFSANLCLFLCLYISFTFYLSFFNFIRVCFCMFYCLIFLYCVNVFLCVIASPFLISLILFVSVSMLLCCCVGLKSVYQSCPVCICLCYYVGLVSPVSLLLSTIMSLSSDFIRSYIFFVFLCHF